MKLSTNFPILLILLGTASGKCPEDPSLLNPCTCIEVWGTPMVTCDHIRNYDDLQKAMDNSSGHHFDTIMFNHCHLPYLNVTWLMEKNVSVFWANQTTFVDLFQNNTDIPSVPSITHFILEGSEISNGFQWKQLAPFTELTYLAVESNRVRKLGRGFRNYVSSKLRDLYVKNSRLRALDDSDLEGKSEISFITMTKNRIKVLKNSNFEDQKNTLERMDFSYNPIEYVPGDLFTGMKVLERFTLKGAKLKTFPNVMHMNVKFVINENPFVCDCQMSWISENKTCTLLGSCESPLPLKSKQFNDLEREDFIGCR